MLRIKQLLKVTQINLDHYKEYHVLLTGELDKARRLSNKWEEVIEKGYPETLNTPPKYNDNLLLNKTASSLSVKI